MNATAIVVTRGDVDLTAIFDSFVEAGFEEGQVLVWDNSKQQDLSVYGRYAAIEHAREELIYVQDDDVVLPPESIQTIVDALRISGHPEGFKGYFEGGWRIDVVACNMPQEFRHAFYEEHALVGFGACFHRDAPRRAFDRFWQTYPNGAVPEDFFNRTCDIVFTGLTPRVLVDVPKTDLAWAHYETRLWKQPGHIADRVRMLDMVRAIQ